MYEYITEQSRVDRLLPELMAQEAWGFDCETTGLDPHVDKQTLIQLGRPDTQYVIDTRVVSVEPLRPFFEKREVKKIAHSFKFEYKMTKGTQGIEVEGGRCTLVAEKVLNAGRKFQGWSLEAIAGDRLNVSFDKELQKSFIGHQGAFSKAQLDYAARDVEFLLPLLQHQTREILRDGLGPTFTLECDAISAFGDMEYDGMILDVASWRAVLQRNILGSAEAKKALDIAVEPLVGTNLFGEVELNYGSPPQVVKLLNQMRLTVKEWNPKTKKETEGPIRATDKKTLKKLRDVPIIKLLQRYRSLQVRINTFGEPYIAAIHPKTGAIHPNFDQLGTETGRPAAGESDVNPLNVPKENEYRNCFIGRENEVVESDDYSGCESRILAEISGDPKLREIFRKNLDIHCAVATELYGKHVTKDNENKKLRAPAKALNFGIAYGMGPGRLYDELNGDGFPVTRDEAKGLFDRYCNSYEVAVKYLRGAGKQAAQEGYLTNLNGRRRYWLLPDPGNSEKYPHGRNDPAFTGRMGGIEREGGNYLIQSVNADITKHTMTEIRTYRKVNKIRTHFINAIYDEVVTRTHKDDSAAFHEAKLKIMRASAEKWIKNVPMLVDGHAGRCWQK